MSVILSRDEWEGELLLTQPCGLPEQHKEVFTADATFIHTVLLLRRRHKGDAVQVCDLLREHGAQHTGP